MSLVLAVSVGLCVRTCVNRLRTTLSVLLSPVTNRGVSDLVGFALLLGIVITGIFLTFTLGFETLLNLGDTQTVDSNTASMDVIQTDFNTVASTSRQARESSPTWTAASLSVEQSSVTISITSSELGLNQTLETSLFVVDESQADRRLVYALGGAYSVFQPSAPSPQAVPELTPNFVFNTTDTSLVLPTIGQVSPQSPTAVATDTTADVSVRAVQTATQSITREASQPAQLTVRVTDIQYPSVWRTFFQQTGVSPSNLTDTESSVTATISTRRVSLFTSTLELSLQS